MESLFILVPLSCLIVLIIGFVLAKAVLSGQFDDLEKQGRQILTDDDVDLPN